MDEKRRAHRYTFGVEQSIAPLVDGKIPPGDVFEPVRCIDISENGIAFYQGKRPDFKEMAVGLGIEPDIVYRRARVAHVEMIELCGKLVFRVGCEFTDSAAGDIEVNGTLPVACVDKAFTCSNNDES